MIYRTVCIRAYDQYDTEVPERVQIGQFYDTDGMFAFFKNKLLEWGSIDEADEAFKDLLELGYYSGDYDDYYFILKEDLTMNSMFSVDLDTIRDDTIREIQQRINSRKVGIKYRKFTTTMVYANYTTPCDYSKRPKITIRGFPGDMRPIMINSIETDYEKKIINANEYRSVVEMYYEPGYSRAEWQRKIRELEVDFEITGLEEVAYITSIIEANNVRSQDYGFEDKV